MYGVGIGVALHGFLNHFEAAAHKVRRPPAPARVVTTPGRKPPEMTTVATRVRSAISGIVGKVAVLRPYRKAVAGFLTPGVIAIGVAVLLSSSPGGHSITSGEWQGALAASLATAGIVWKIRNK